MGDYTRLSDIPPASENITYQIPTQFPPQQQQVHPPQPQPQFQPQLQQFPPSHGNPAAAGLGNNNYVPINPHPNPYGNNPNSNGIPPWDSRPPPPQSDQTTSLDDLPPFVPTQQHRLPSRDIPSDTTRFAQDEETQANYVPTPPPAATRRVNDYIKEYDASESHRVREHEVAKHRQYWVEETLRSYQIPLLLAVLYFVFQMHMVSRVLFLYLGKLGLFYQDDGSLNVNGMILKSTLFAGVYWAIQTILYHV